MTTDQFEITDRLYNLHKCRYWSLYLIAVVARYVSLDDGPSFVAAVRHQLQVKVGILSGIVNSLNSYDIAWYDLPHFHTICVHQVGNCMRN